MLKKLKFVQMDSKSYFLLTVSFLFLFAYFCWYHCPVGCLQFLCLVQHSRLYLILQQIRKHHFLWWCFMFIIFLLNLILQKYNVQCCLISAGEQSDWVVNIYTLFFIFFSIMVYHRMLNIVPCAIQQDLVYISYTQ